jgi:hypothetical protein
LPFYFDNHAFMTAQQELVRNTLAVPIERSRQSDPAAKIPMLKRSGFTGEI